MLNGLVHDLVHSNYQKGVAGLSTDPGGFGQYTGLATEPRWMSEGMASLIQQLALSGYRGSRDYSELRDYAARRAKALDMSLSEVELYPISSDTDEGRGFGNKIIECIYRCGQIAVELLASRVGLGKLSDYYTHLEPWMIPRGVPPEEYPRPGWRLAFERAYGMTIEEFYELFEEHRAAGFPAVDIPSPQVP